MFIQVPLRTRRLAFAGKVVDAVTALPIAGVVATLAGRPERALSGADGCFAFLDLPDGDYAVSLALPRAGTRYGGAVHRFMIPRTAAGAIDLVELPPTGVRGSVRAAGSGAPLPLARVRVEGSRELAYGGEDGGFYLGGVEAGERRLSVGAVGYGRVEISVRVDAGSVADLGTIVLQPAAA